MQIQISASEKEALEQALGNMKDVQASILQVQPAADLEVTHPKIACTFHCCCAFLSSYSCVLFFGTHFSLARTYDSYCCCRFWKV